MKLILAPLVAVVVLLFPACSNSSALPNDINYPDDLYGRVIGVLYGMSSVHFAREIGFAREFHGVAQLLAALEDGTIDAVLIESAIDLGRTPRLTRLSEPLIEYDLRIAVAKENTELLRVIDNALLTLEENGTLPGLRRRHLAGQSFTYVPPEGIERRPGYLTVAIPHYFPPFVVPRDDGSLIGLDIGVIIALSDMFGMEFRVLQMEHDELITSVWFGRADLALGFIPGEHDEEMVNFSSGYARSEQVIIVRR